MPYINVKTTEPVTHARAERITGFIKKVCSRALGKGEDWVMTDFIGEAHLHFRNSRENICYVEVSMYGHPHSAATEAMTEELTAYLSEELTIPAERIYIAYFGTDHWGWNGHNF